MFTLDKIYKEALMSLSTLSLMETSETAMTFFISETKEFAKAVHGEEKTSPGCITSRRTFNPPHSLNEFLVF